jgi:seryl-tRNA(Sec) selenium transferase
MSVVLSTRAKGAKPALPDDYRDPGIRPLIDACGNYTRFTASLMPAEVLQAIEYASNPFLRFNELQDAVGARIASLVGAEAAMASAGTFSLIALGTAACLAGKNPNFIRRLPETSAMKNEVIIQKSHRNNYNHAIRMSGGS